MDLTNDTIHTDRSHLIDLWDSETRLFPKSTCFLAKLDLPDTTPMAKIKIKLNAD
jgi:hypothetical protein